MNRFGMIRKKFALVSLLMLVLVILFQYFGIEYNIPLINLFILKDVMMPLGVIGGILFWLLMLVDLFKHSTLKNKALWGICLLIFTWPAAMVYYFAVYLKKE
ncbi:hypothetical protein M3P05_12470 [Sansalvadorimonas sp. 2012CJ34-2]|uniref:Cardiolipin synthase N-terminal domain-containing protein n=1 Tax=Parendozoicomonas callyspongiae TaxID=2942213 RepID=A0ABT0PH77_9GAMM|nr:hypothetical protein [Sansalvadorimonas sp. 2012CJ34-2]MCL6270739.1 hypothetical protein [Sansalvadorimonas sp. 2012CJ34-2]